jgi:hypothetical protein
VWYNVVEYLEAMMQVNSHKPYLCIDCGAPVGRRVKRCPECHQIALPKRQTYERTPELNQAMSTRTTGIRRSTPSASTQPEVAEKIRQWWTPERREAARQRGLEFSQRPEWRLNCGMPGEKNPMWEGGRTKMPYARGWARKVKALAWERAGNRCEICQSDTPRDTHHKDFRKDNHELENLQVLCRSCHKRLHAEHRRLQRQ